MYDPDAGPNGMPDGIVDTAQGGPDLDGDGINDEFGS